MTSRRQPLALSLALAALALPAIAQAPAKGEAPKIKPFETAQLTTNTWYGRFGRTNSSWMDLGDGVLVVDTAGTKEDVANLAGEIKRTTKGKPVRWLVVTHSHQDNNGALASLITPDVTVFAAEKVAGGLASYLSGLLGSGRQVPVIGIPDHLALVFGSHAIQLFRPKRPAHTDNDVVVFAPESGIAFVGDLVTPGRCPMMSDPGCDPNGWGEALDQVLSLQPLVLVPTHGDAAVRPDPKIGMRGLDLDNEVKTTREYIAHVKSVLMELKKKNAPEANVASELRLAKAESYCPRELDAVNGIALYRRMTPQGEFAPLVVPAPAKPPAKNAKK